MKWRKPLAIALSLAFTLVLTLAMVFVPSAVASAQTSKAQPRSVNSEDIALAIETLEELVEAGGQTAAIYVTLGDIYRNMDQNTLAEKSYKKALKLVNDSGTLEILVAAKAGLAEIKADLGELDEANLLRQKAKKGYEALADLDSEIAGCTCQRTGKYSSLCLTCPRTLLRLLKK